MSTSYVDPASGALYPLDIPRWRGDDGAPLLLTPGAGIGRDDIDTAATLDLALPRGAGRRHRAARSRWARAARRCCSGSGAL